MTPRSDHEEEMSMEEILASIRKFVTDNPQDSEGKSNSGAPRGANPHEPIAQSITQQQHAYYPEFENSPIHSNEAFPAMTPEHHHAVLRSTIVDSASNQPVHHPNYQKASEPLYQTHHQGQISEPASDSDILELTTPLNPTQGPAPQHTPWNPPSRSQTQKKALEESIMTLTNPIGGKKTDNPLRDAIKSSPVIENDENLGSSKTVSASASSLSRLAQASKNAPKRTPNLADQRGVTLDQMIQDLIRPMIKQWIDNHLPSLVEDMVAKEIKRITKHLG